MNGWLFDIEADNLYLHCKQVWYIKIASWDNRRQLKVYPFRVGKEAARAQLVEWIDSFEDGAVVGSFNGLSYDHFVLWRMFDLPVAVGKKGGDKLNGKPVTLLDVFYMAQFLDPNLPSHSLANLTRGSAAEKTDYRAALVEAGAMTGNEPKGHEFTFYHELIDGYCDDDVEATRQLGLRLVAEMQRLYKGMWNTPAYRLGQKTFYLMKAQEHSGVGFDSAYAEVVAQQLDNDMAALEATVLPQLPPRDLKKGEEAEYTMPAKPYKKNGELSSHMVGFIAKHNGKVLDDGTVEFYGKVYAIEPKTTLDVKLPMVIGDQQHFKSWLISIGWEPTFYNLQKDANGKPMRDDKGKVIETSPKIQEGGVLCPNLQAMEGQLIKDVVKFLSLRNRRSVLTSWMANARLAFDGRIGASATKIAVSHRQCHSVVCNVPRAGGGSLYGDEFRSLFCAQGDNVLVGADSAGLEQRCAGHMTYRYDGGAYADELLKGDVHSKTAVAMFPDAAKFDITSPDFSKDDPAFKPWRNKAKAAGYGLLYGCSPEKLAKMVGARPAQGKTMHKAFWDANPALEKFVANLTKYWETTGGKKVVPAVDGRLLKARSRHSLANTILQSLGAIAMDTACCIMDTMLGEMKLDELGRPYYELDGCKVIRVLYYH